MDLSQVRDHPLSDAIDDAQWMLEQLTAGKKKWKTSIPAQNDDPDVVFAVLIREAKRYMEKIEEIRQT